MKGELGEPAVLAAASTNSARQKASDGWRWSLVAALRNRAAEAVG